MGTVANTAPFVEYGSTTPVSKGGKRRVVMIGTVTMSNSYATGGDTITVPVITGYSLKAVEVVNRTDGTRLYDWDGSTATPKLKAYTGLAAEAVATTDLSAVAARTVILTYET